MGDNAPTRLLLRLLLLVAACVPVLCAPLVLSTPQGLVRGRLEAGGIRAFRGIPFAEPPVGQRRFASPTLLTTFPPAHSGPDPDPQPQAVPYDATFDRSPCVQPGSAGSGSRIAGAEDCLYLNLFTPANLAPGDRLPVLVYIHGGGFVSGSPGEYPGVNLVRASEGVVAVSIAYRLSVFGFLAVPSLSDDGRAVGDIASSGNFGFEDQLAALQWVQNNIASYGGDPTRVTIAGQSAGSISSCLHLVSPRSAGLFHRVLLESGACDTGIRTLAESEELGMNLTKAAALIPGLAACSGGFGRAAQLICLRSDDLTLEYAMALCASASCFDIFADTVLLPSVDGITFLEHPSVSFAHGRINRADVLVGATEREMGVFMPPITSQYFPKPNAASIADWAEKRAEGDAIIRNYYVNGTAQGAFDSDYSAMVSLLSKSNFQCPTRRLARSMASLGQRVFYYSFNYSSPLHMYEWVRHTGGAFHASDVMFAYKFATMIDPVFEVGVEPDTLARFAVSMDEQISLIMRAYWTRFIISGDVNAPIAMGGLEAEAAFESLPSLNFSALPVWAPVSSNGVDSLYFHHTGDLSMQHDTWMAECDLWDRSQNVTVAAFAFSPRLVEDLSPSKLPFATGPTAKKIIISLCVIWLLAPIFVHWTLIAVSHVMVLHKRVPPPKPGQTPVSNPTSAQHSPNFSPSPDPSAVDSLHHTGNGSQAHSSTHVRHGSGHGTRSASLDRPSLHQKEALVFAFRALSYWPTEVHPLKTKRALAARESHSGSPEDHAIQMTQLNTARSSPSLNSTTSPAIAGSSAEPDEPPPIAVEPLSPTSPVPPSSLNESSPSASSSVLPKSILAPLSRCLLKSVSGHFASGEIVAIMGGSGSGKSTLLELLTLRRSFGMVSGDVLIGGQSVQASSAGRCVLPWVRESIGFVSQFGSPTLPELSVRENLVYAAMLRLDSSMSMDDKLRRVDSVIAACGLTAVQDVSVGSEGQPGGLSGGQKRRVGVALELLSRPRFLFLDEPTSGLDASSALELMLVLYAYAQSGHAVVLSIHQPRREIFELFSKVILIDSGRIVFQGEPGHALPQMQRCIEKANLPDSERATLMLEAGRAEREELSTADFILDALRSPPVVASLVAAYSTGEDCPEQRELEMIDNLVDRHEHARPEYERFQKQFARQPHAPDTLAIGAKLPFHLRSQHAWLQSQRQRTSWSTSVRRWSIRLFALESRRMLSVRWGMLLKLPFWWVGFGVGFAWVFFYQMRFPLTVACWMTVLVTAGVQCALTHQITIFYSSIPVWEKENMVGAVSSAQHNVSVYLHVSGTILTASLLCWVPGLCLSAVPAALTAASFGMELLLLCMCFNTFTLFFLAVVSHMRTAWSLDNTASLGSIGLTVSSFFTGFMILIQDIPKAAHFLLYINPLYWTFGGLLRVRLGSMSEALPEMKVDPTALQLMHIYRLENTDVSGHLLILLLMQLFYAALAWFVLDAPWQRKQPAPVPFSAADLKQADEYATIERQAQADAHRAEQDALDITMRDLRKSLSVRLARSKKIKQLRASIPDLTHDSRHAAHTPTMGWSPRSSQPAAAHARRTASCGSFMTFSQPTTPHQGHSGRLSAVSERAQDDASSSPKQAVSVAPPALHPMFSLSSLSLHHPDNSLYNLVEEEAQDEPRTMAASPAQLPPSTQAPSQPQHAQQLGQSPHNEPEPDTPSVLNVHFEPDDTTEA